MDFASFRSLFECDDLAVHQQVNKCAVEAGSKVPRPNSVQRQVWDQDLCRQWLVVS